MGPSKILPVIIVIWLTISATIAGGVSMLSDKTALLKSMEHWTSDWRTALLADRAATQHQRIAVVLVDDEAVQSYPYRSPVDRGLLARLIEVLDGAGARVIGLDFLFDQATEPDKDRQLIAAIRKASDKVVIGTIDQRMALREDRRAYMRRFVQDAGVSVGYLNLRIEIDRVIRGEADPLPAGTGAGGVQDSFAMAVARKAGVQNVVLAPRIAWLRAPRDGTDTFNILPAAQIVAPASEDERKMAQMLLAGLKDRVVLIGGDLSDQADRHATPLAKLGEGGAPGVIVHAQAVAQKLDGRRLGLLDLTWERLLVLAMSLVGFLVGWRFRATHWVTSTLPIIVLGLIDAIFFAGLRTIVPFAAPAIAWVLAVWCGRGVRLVTLKLAL